MKTIDYVEILLVEDNPNDADLTIRELKKHNLANKLAWVKDGEEALDFIFGEGSFAERDSKYKPKVVFLDLKLPKIDGIEVLKEIRSREATKLLPLVILSSSREDQDIIKSYNLGVNSYIVKPVEFEDFSRAIREIGYYWVVSNQQPLF